METLQEEMAEVFDKLVKGSPRQLSLAKWLLDIAETYLKEK